MKLDRMMQILTILIEKRKVQAKDLAEMFEVSVRTIYRDIDALNLAGVPVVSFQGSGGGITLLEGYHLGKTMFTTDEISAILIALKSLSVTVEDEKTIKALQKMNLFIPDSKAADVKQKTNRFIIDHNPWSDYNPIRKTTALVEEAIEQNKLLEMTYDSVKGESLRRAVEPHLLILKGYQWYMYAYCRVRKDFRLFKVARITQPEILTETFSPRPIDIESAPWDADWGKEPNTCQITLKAPASMKVLMEDWYGAENVSLTGDGHILIRAQMLEDEWLYGWILSFGPRVQVTDPPHIREIVAQRVLELNGLYNG